MQVISRAFSKLLTWRAFGTVFIDFDDETSDSVGYRGDIENLLGMRQDLIKDHVQSLRLVVSSGRSLLRSSKMDSKRIAGVSSLRHGQESSRGLPVPQRRLPECRSQRSEGTRRRCRLSMPAARGTARTLR